MSKVAVVTDSTASLSEEYLRESGVVVVPLHVVIGAKDHREGMDEEATPAFVAAALREWTPVSTSRPAPSAFLDVYRRAAEAGAEEIVSIHLSGEISGTYESCQLAAKESPVPVRCVDTRQVGPATGYAVQRAVDVLAAGGDALEAADAARRAGEGAVSLFYVDTLEYLKRGGRIGSAAALVGSALSVKPILQVKDGRVTTLEKVRTSARALARLEELAVAAADGRPVDVAVAHLASLDRAQILAGALEQRLVDNLEARQLRLVEVGAVIGAHVGPGLVAVCVVSR
jgi:DegV family protein with EDD domain